MIKQKLINAFEWTKSKVKKFWRWLLGFLIIGVAVVSIGGLSDEIPEHAILKVPMEKVLFAYDRANGVVKYGYQTYEVPFAENEIDWGSNYRKFRVGELTKNGKDYYINNFIFTSGNPDLYQDKSGKRWKIFYATSTRKYFNVQMNLTDANGFFVSSVYAQATSTTFNPDADPETSSMDGYVTNSPAAKGFLDLRDDAVGTAADDNEITLFAFRLVGKTSNTFTDLRRGIILFDTSPIEDDVVVVTSTLDFRINQLIDDMALLPSLALVGVTTTSTTSMAVEDFNIQNFATSTEFANRIAFNDLAVGREQMILNLDGRNAINLTGVTSFGLINGNYDLDGINPPTSTPDSADTRIRVGSADGANDPFLAVTYTIAVVRRIMLIH